MNGLVLILAALTMDQAFKQHNNFPSENNFVILYSLIKFNNKLKTSVAETCEKLRTGCQNNLLIFVKKKGCTLISIFILF